MANHEQTMHSFGVMAFRARLESLGIDPVELFETTISRRESAVDTTQPDYSPPSVHEVLETAVTMSEDPALAIRIGQDIDLADYGAYGFAIMSCANADAALNLFFRYAQTFLPSSSWHRISHEEGLVIRLIQNTGTDYQKMLVTELAFSQIHAFSGLLSTRPAQGASIHFDYPKPAHFPAYEDSWPLTMEFDQEHCQIVLSDQLLSQGVRTADPATNVLFTQQCEEILRGMAEVKETSAAVRRFLIRSAGEFMKISEVADQLHVSERTLRRRLSAETTDFRTIVDEVRNTLAQNYLRKTALSVVEISDLLQYAETSNFHRAFQRWNSTTPSEYRRRASLHAHRSAQRR